MNVSQALEYERQPFIPMFIYGDHGAMESERQKGEEALKVLETEYFTAEGDPGFDFATVRDLADRNRDLCDQIGEARLRNVTPATLSRGLSDADTCAAIGKMQKRTAASVMREIAATATRSASPTLASPSKARCWASTSKPPVARPSALHHQRGLGNHGAHQRRRAA